MRSHDYSEEAEMIAAYQNGNLQALAPLFDSYLPLLRVLANRLHCPGGMTEDLIQSGNMGLLLAAKGFKAEYNVRFVTYAVPWILGEMKKSVRMHLSQIRMLSLQYTDNEQEASMIERLSSSEERGFNCLDLRIAIGMLSDEERRIVCLRYFKDKTQSETARILHKSQSQISRLEQRALNDLKRNLT